MRYLLGFLCLAATLPVAAYDLQTWRFKASAGELELDGQDGGQWIGLESTLDDGKVIRYEPIAIATQVRP